MATIERMRCWLVPMRPVTPFIMMPILRSATVCLLPALNAACRSCCLCETFGQIYAQRAAHPQLPVIARSRQLVHSALEEVIEAPLLQLLELLPGSLCSSEWTA